VFFLRNVGHRWKTQPGLRQGPLAGLIIALSLVAVPLWQELKINVERKQNKNTKLTDKPIHIHR